MYKLYLHLSFSESVWDTQLVLCWLRLASGLFVLRTTNNLGVPVSSRGTLEYNRVDLTIYIPTMLINKFVPNLLNSRRFCPALLVMIAIILLLQLSQRLYNQLPEGQAQSIRVRTLSLSLCVKTNDFYFCLMHPERNKNTINIKSWIN